MVNSILSFVLAVLVYPGVFIAVLAAWGLVWGRESMRAVVSREAMPGPLRDVSEVIANLSRDILHPEGIYPWLTSIAAGVALILPVIALILLPIPGNPLVQAIGLKGDVVAGAVLLLAVPILRLLVAWATPSPFTRLAADRGARLLAGVVLTMALAITAATEQSATLTLHPTPTRAPLALWWLVTHVLAALAFIFVLPPLTRMAASRHQPPYQVELVAGEMTEVNGRDLACFRIAESLQLVAVCAYFATVFLLPLFPSAFGHGRDLLWIAMVIVSALGLGAWDGITARLPASSERPPLSWWLGLPVLIALFSLVTAAIALRGS
jgi:NADH-quinone oxidoreductase subunit H